MGDLSAALGVAPNLSRNATADAAMVRAKAGLNAQKMKEVNEAAKNFEGMFISEMMSHMFETSPVDSEFGGGQAEETWRGMMVEEYSKKIVASGGLGMSDAIKAQMIAMQEEHNQ